MLRDKDQRWYSARPAVDGTLPPTRKFMQLHVGFKKYCYWKSKG